MYVPCKQSPLWSWFHITLGHSGGSSSAGVHNAVSRGFPCTLGTIATRCSGWAATKIKHWLFASRIKHCFGKLESFLSHGWRRLSTHPEIHFRDKIKQQNLPKNKENLKLELNNGNEIVKYVNVVQLVNSRGLTNVE